MLAKKAIYENGRITFADKRLPRGKMAVIVTFLQDDEALDINIRNRQAFAEKWAGALSGSDVDSVRQQRLDELHKKHA